MSEQPSTEGKISDARLQEILTLYETNPPNSGGWYVAIVWLLRELQERRRSPEPSGWQPIETAPPREWVLCGRKATTKFSCWWGYRFADGEWIDVDNAIRDPSWWMRPPSFPVTKNEPPGSPTTELPAARGNSSATRESGGSTATTPEEPYYRTYDSGGLCGCTRVLAKGLPAPVRCGHGHEFKLRTGFALNGRGSK